MLQFLLTLNLLFLMSDGKHVLELAGFKSVSATAGENVILQCDFSTDQTMELPMLTIRWSKNGITKAFFNETCCSSQQNLIREEDVYNGKANLYLGHVQEKDSGVYTCAIKYRTIEKSLKITLSVREGKLDVSTGPPTILANPGDKVPLNCFLQGLKGEVDLKNLVIQWFTRGKQVAEFDDKITIEKPGLSMSLDAIKKGDGTLTIESFKADDAGTFRCYITYGTEFVVKQIVLTANVTSKADEHDELSSCETVLDKKLDKVINLLGTLDGKLEDLGKGCPSKRPGSN